MLSATEIQNIQVGEGDVQRDMAIPIHMIFPRLFTCPTLITDNFKVGKCSKSSVKANRSVFTSPFVILTDPDVISLQSLS
jgi:hypothetical protein